MLGRQRTLDDVVEGLESVHPSIHVMDHPLTVTGSVSSPFAVSTQLIGDLRSEVRGTREYVLLEGRRLPRTITKLTTIPGGAAKVVQANYSNYNGSCLFDAVAIMGLEAADQTATVFLSYY